MLEYSFSRLFVPWNIRSLDRSFLGPSSGSRERINTADLSLLGLDQGVTRSSFCSSACKFCGWLAGSSRKIWLRLSNVSIIGLSVRSSGNWTTRRQTKSPKLIYWRWNVMETMKLMLAYRMDRFSLDCLGVSFRSTCGRNLVPFIRLYVGMW